MSDIHPKQRHQYDQFLRSVITPELTWIDSSGFISGGFDYFEALYLKHGPEIFPLHGHYPHPTDNGAPNILPFRVQLNLINGLALKYETQRSMDNAIIEVRQQLPNNFEDNLPFPNQFAIVTRSSASYAELQLSGRMHYIRTLARYRTEDGRARWVDVGRRSWTDFDYPLRGELTVYPASRTVLYSYLSKRLFNEARNCQDLNDSQLLGQVQRAKRYWHMTYIANGFYGFESGAHGSNHTRPSEEEIALYRQMVDTNVDMSAAEIKYFIEAALKLASQSLPESADVASNG